MAALTEQEFRHGSGVAPAVALTVDKGWVPRHTLLSKVIEM